MDWTFLRDTLYLDIIRVFVGAGGVTRGAAGHGRLAAAAQDDIAELAVTRCATLAPPIPGRT